MGAKRLKAVTLSLLLMLVLLPCLFSQEETQEAVYKKAIYYVMMDSKSGYQIGIMDDHGRNKRILTGEGNNWCPSVSPQGDRVAFYSDRSGYANLYIMYANGAGQKPLTHDSENITDMDLFNRGQIAWEKEGEEIYFLKKGDVWKVYPNGDNPTALTTTHGINMFRLSPDGNRIVFSREYTKKHCGMWSMQAKGTSLRQIVASEIISPAFDWGDDNVFAYFHNRGIFSMTYVGVEKKFITDNYYPDNDIAWAKSSPDRRSNLIAFISAENNGPNIWLMKHDGTEKRQLTDRGGFSPYWLPDGTSLLYVEQNDIYRINSASGEKARLTYFFKSYYPVYAEIKLAAQQQTAQKDGEKDAAKK